jgi:hypothetical protein
MRNKAYAHEMKEKKFNAYLLIIKTLISRYNLAPHEVDYSGEMAALIRANLKDRKLIKQAEQEAYIRAR